MLDWLIIGGGVHGTHLAYALTAQHGVSRDTIRVLDPHPAPLRRWNTFTHNAGMHYLRSPHVHHLDTNPQTLMAYARQHAHLKDFTFPHQRPGYALFQSHTAGLIARNNLPSLFVQGTAQDIMTTRGGFRVDTDNGILRAKRVVLAIGRTELNWPHWVSDLCHTNARVHHVFDLAFDRAALSQWEHAGVIGGGITGAQLALSLAERQPGTVTQMSRHALREAHFDSSPCWLGPRCKGQFVRAKTVEARRRLITEARNPGSVPEDIARDLKRAAESGMLRRQIGDITSAEAQPNGTIKLLCGNGDTLLCDLLLLATGFDAARPGGKWLDFVKEDFGLPTARDGYPIVDETLQWSPRLFVMGQLAELEIGPPAPNIIGARLAATRIARTL